MTGRGVALAAAAFALAGCATTAPQVTEVAGPPERPAPPQTEVVDLGTGAPRDTEAAVEWLAGHRHVYVAEHHTDRASHQAQLDVMQRLHARGVPLAMAIEYLPADTAPALARYVAGELHEAGLLEAVDWKHTWGHTFEAYAALFRFARAHGVPIWPLDAPRGLARKVARGGVDGLEPEDAAALSALDSGTDAHRAWFDEVMTEAAAAHGGAHGSLSTAQLDRLYTAQLLRDETMAHNLADRLAADPLRHAVVLAGAGHIVQGLGVPSRARALSGLDYAIVLPGGAEDGEEPAGDLGWTAGRDVSGP